ncbi:ubiquitin-conjugating enzyme [Astrocystis sublimbata]|nr:ubiquitin-conjugating enzyme [Astrocystis sublimbata]
MASPVADMTIALVSESDLYKWAVTMPGPPGTCYAGGTFNLTITLPREYPFQPPKLNFATRIYHPNVTDDSLGNVCLGMLKPETWKPAGRIKAVLVAVRQLLVEPNPDDPLENGIAELFRSNRPEFEKNAKSYVQRYAGGKP